MKNSPCSSPFVSPYPSYSCLIWCCRKLFGGTLWEWQSQRGDFSPVGCNRHHENLIEEFGGEDLQVLRKTTTGINCRKVSSCNQWLWYICNVRPCYWASTYLFLLRPASLCTFMWIIMIPCPCMLVSELYFMQYLFILSDLFQMDHKLLDQNLNCIMVLQVK